MDDERPAQSLVVVLYYVGLEDGISSSIVLLDKNPNNLQYAAAAHLTPVPSVGGRPPKIKRSYSLSSLDTQQNQKEYGAHLTEMKSWYSKWNSRWNSWWCPTYCVNLEKDYVAHINVPPGYPLVSRWKFCNPTNLADLCVMPDSGSCCFPIDVQLKGCLFNLRTKKFKTCQPLYSCHYYDHAVAVGEHIYFLTHYTFMERGSFVRYHPVSDSWDILEPFPNSNYEGAGVFATAVLDDTIVLNVLFNLWAYNIGTNKWYRVSVDVDDTECCKIVGLAVVLNNTIYALKRGPCDSILALSIIKKKVTNVFGLEFEFSCSLLSKIDLPGMIENEIMYDKSEEKLVWESRHLVLLGEDNFCIVQSFNTFVLINYQSIQVTYIELKKGKMNVAGTCIYKLKLPQKVQFHVMAGFSLPDSEASALKEGKGTIFTFNPYPEDYVSEQKDKNQEAEVPEVSTPPDEYLQGHYLYPEGYVSEQEDINQEALVPKVSTLPDEYYPEGLVSEQEDKNQEAEVPMVSTPPDEYYHEGYVSEQEDKNQEAEVSKVSTPPDEYSPPRNDFKGHCIYVRNLGQKVNVKMIEQRLKQFGAIKRDGIQVLRNKKGKGKHAIVEFECADSKKRAIEASPIKFGGFLAEILDKR